MVNNSPKNTPSISTFRERADLKKNPVGTFADFLTRYFGSVWFLTLNIIFFVFWVIWNLGLTPPLKPFDPYPFNFLTMVVSLEAIFLSIIVLISQNRAGKIADLREEVDLVINTRAEEQITRALKILDEIHDHLGLNPKDDQELVEMKKGLDIDELEEQLER